MRADASSLPFCNSIFDRVVVTCLLHHVDQPEKVFEEINRVLKSGGSASIFLSCDPGVVVRILRFLTTARKSRSRGFEGYTLMAAREHRNHVGSLLPMAKFVFRNRNMKVSYFPWRIPSWNLNGYVIIQIS